MEFIVRELFRKDQFRKRRGEKVRENSTGRMRCQVKADFEPDVEDGILVHKLN